jgi:hypothetical protein
VNEVREPRLGEPRKQHGRSDPVVSGQQNQAVSFGELGLFGHVECNSIKVDSPTGFLQITSLTTTERNALTAVNGMVVYNETDNKFQGYENGSWANLI